MVQGTISSVLLSNPLAPVRITYGPIPASYVTKNLPIWNSKAVTPATFAKNESLELILQATLSDCPQQELTLLAEFLPSTGLNASSSAKFTFPYNGTGEINVPIAFSFDIGAPWGIHGALKWDVETQSGEKVPFGETPVELYALTPMQFNAFLSSGIPQDFLKIMVLPTLRHGIKSEDDWIKWAVYKCFNSAPENGDINESGGENEPIHTFRYDTVDLASSFSSALGSDFALDTWLSHRIATNPWGLANCYDQAGLAIVALSLGIPFDRLRWQHLHRFGRLSTEGTNLFGWGKVNNTYGWNVVVSKKMLPQNDSERHGFSNHSFASVEIGGIDMAIDACAGPVAANYTLPEYVKNAIDHETILDNEPGNGHRPGTVEDLHKGDESRFGLPMTSDFPISSKTHSWKTDKWAGNFWASVAKDKKELKNTINDVSKLKNLPQTPDRKPVDLRSLLASLTVEASKEFPSQSEETPEMVLTEGKPKPGETNVKVGPGGAVTQWTFKSVRVIFRILPSPEIAQQVYCARIMSSVDAGKVFKSPTEDQHKGCCHTVGTSGDTVELWYYENLLVEVLRVPTPQSDLTVEWVAKFINDFIQPGGDPKGVSPGAFDKPEVIKKPATVNVHDEFEISIHANGAYIVAAQVNGGGLLLKNRKKDGATWVFAFLAARASSNEIVFTSFHEETFQTKSENLIIDVKPLVA
ncbi:hypothetical protein GALMADRAFT_206100 [Galerina marginata CBS 339.88]|uniref:Uncharacterized protein n=1 Tax=Galerina marginata (strain CBS 339.88) TaxID=685588 RepID=A0A067TX42_GALM3|nr:hypothetical protein GALMADRAFT_206100 [Galerina marginata CBS 339.88]